MDFVRVVYYKVMTFFCLADLYRNEQYMFKPDFFYNIEKLLLTANLNSLNRQRINDDLSVIFVYVWISLYLELNKLISQPPSDWRIRMSTV
jgi:hypothetical protein